MRCAALSSGIGRTSFRSYRQGRNEDGVVIPVCIGPDDKAVEADLGPVRYLATLIGSSDEQTMRWFILVVALLLDPAAVLLLLAACGAREN